MEKLTGTEALKTLPFYDIAIPKDVAASLLTERTQKAVKENVAYIKTDVESPNLQVLSLAFDELANTVDEWCSYGGFSMSQDEIISLYDKMGKFSFKQLAEHVLTQSYPKAIRENDSYN